MIEDFNVKYSCNHFHDQKVLNHRVILHLQLCCTHYAYGLSVFDGKFISSHCKPVDNEMLYSLSLI